jgi:Putative zinc- or iron-chelating domain
MGEAKRRGGAGAKLRRLYGRSGSTEIGKLVLPAGPGLPPRESALAARAIAEAVRTRVRAALIRGSAAGTIDRMLDAIDGIGAECTGLYEEALARAAAENKIQGAELAGVACRRGCAFCCYVDVDVTPLEAIRLARRAVDAAPASLETRRAPCPLLVDGACSQYERRPLACRAVFSPDARRCEAGYLSEDAVSVPSLEWPRHLAAGYITGEIAALDDLGLASHMVVLRQALGVLAADASAVPKWLNGADVFPRRGAAVPQ